MPPKTLAEQVEGLIEAIPATGEINYRALYDNVMATDNRGALQQIHQLKREGRIKMRTSINQTTGKPETFVSRA